MGKFSRASKKKIKYSQPATAAKDELVHPGGVPDIPDSSRPIGPPGVGGKIARAAVYWYCKVRICDVVPGVEKYSCGQAMDRMCLCSLRV